MEGIITSNPEYVWIHSPRISP